MCKPAIADNNLFYEKKKITEKGKHVFQNLIA